MITSKDFGLTPKNPIVLVKQGRLKGAEDTLYNGGGYLSFKDIPYATPPIGKLRFKAPQPPKAWSEIRTMLQNTVQYALKTQVDMQTLDSRAY